MKAILSINKKFMGYTPYQLINLVKNKSTTKIKVIVS